MSSDVRIADIPQAVLDEVEGAIRHFLIPICTFSERNGSATLDLKGSGTLVRVEEKHYVLTASHVWKATESSDELYLVISEKPTGYRIPRKVISPSILGNDYNAWGPDLALLEIPQSETATISAKKSFLDLCRQRERYQGQPFQANRKLWAVVGSVAELYEHEVDEANSSISAHVRCRALFSCGSEMHEKPSYDYLDISANLALPGVPQRFGGVSGGGLWEIGLTTSDNSISWNGKRALRGVAFWESPTSQQRRFIRCHGPRSLFNTAWKSWHLP